MVTIPTILSKFAVDYGDNSTTIASNDPLEITAITEDYCFDFSTPLGYAGGVLPAVGAATLAAGQVNVANDDQLALNSLANAAAIGHGSALTTTLSPVNSASLPTVGGTTVAQGLDFTGKTYSVVHKSGVPDNRVGEPTYEGFMDCLRMAWVKMASAPAGNLNIIGSSTNGGIRLANTLIAFDQINNLQIGQLSTGSWALLGVHYSFNVGAGTSTCRRFLNGAEVGAVTAGIAPSAYQSNVAANREGVAGQSGSATFPGLIQRPRRIFTAVSGYALDPAALVAAEWAAGRALLGV